LHLLCHIEDIDPETGKEVLVSSPQGNRYVALFLYRGQLRAYHNCCPHQGRSLNFAPDQFLFDKDHTLVCPHHGACFDISNGLCISGPCEGSSLTPIAVEIRNGEIYLSENHLAHGSANASDSE
jgi:nitrite reductase/ring-hydroxylating ferredoxin subunit